MKKEKLLTISVIFLLLLNLGTLGFLLMRHGPPGHDGMGPGGPPPVDKLIIEGLKLDPAQISKFEVLKKEHHAAMERFENENKKIHDAYFQLLKSDSPDTNSLKHLSGEISNLAAKRDSITFDHFSKLRSLCKPEQKPLFDDLIDEIVHTMHQRGKGPHRGPEGPPGR